MTTEVQQAYNDGWTDAIAESAERVLDVFFRVMEEKHWSTDVVTTNTARAETLAILTERSPSADLRDGL